MEEKQMNQSGTEDKKEKTRTNPFAEKSLLSIGLMIFLVFCACIIVFFLFFRYNGFALAWDKLSSIMQPITFGAIIAYLINPVMMFLERHIIHFFTPKVKNQEKLKKTARSLGTIGALLFLVLIVVGLFGLVLPSVIKSIVGLVNTVPEQVENFTNWLDHTAASDSEAVDNFSKGLLSATDYLEDWLQNTVLPEASTYITSITTGVISFFKGFLNIIIGLIVSTYILFSKEKFVGQFKKLTYALLDVETGNKIIKTIRKSNEIFGGFIVGKLIDSLIIGIICFIILSIMKMPYTVLVSVIIGVTNIIPFFGPIIGAIPSFLLIVLASPLQGLYFLIFVLILQQVDGNIIGPKILGNSTGLSSFWVIFAILVGNGLFGVPGMILGVPTFAVIYYLIQRLSEYRLKKKSLPVDTESYISVVKVDKATHTMIYTKEEKPKNKKAEKEKKEQ